MMIDVATSQLRGRVADGKLPEDIVSEVVAELIARNALSGVGNVAGFLTTVVKRRCLDALDRGKRQTPTAPDELPQALVTGTGEAALANIESADLKAMVDGLPARQRHVIVERVMKGRSAKDVAEELGVTSQRIAQIKNEALANLRNNPGFIAKRSDDNTVPGHSPKDPSP